MTDSEEKRGDHDIYLPATDDWPRGYGEASWWPITTAIGAVSFIIGVGVYIVGNSIPAVVNSSLGVIVSLVGILVAVSGITGWVYHGFIAQYRKKSADPHENKYLWGMLLYFPIEFALIGAGILYFAFIYTRSWPPGELPPIFTPLVWIMTMVLLVSSLTNYFASRELRKGNKRRFLALLAATLILGILFLAGKAANFYRLIVQEGYTIESGIYWTAFFNLSGFHGLLVITGIVMMLVVLARTLAGHYSADRHVSVTTVTWYWWMVDSIWLILIVELHATAHLCRSSGMC